MVSHDRLHRRHARAAWPDPKAIADAIAEANPFAKPKGKADAEAKAAQTLVSVVYVTASPTFDGPIGGYKTLGQDEATTTKAANTKQSDDTTKATAAPSKASTDAATTDTQTKARATTKSNTLQTSTGLPTAISAPETSLSSSLDVVAATGGPSTTSNFRSVATSASASSPTSSASPVAQGMSAGGKAGLAIGILLLVGGVLAIVLFVFKRKKDAAKKQQRLDDEKSAMFAGAGRAPSTRTTATAPRLSLRPVTQFLPNLGGEKRASRGNALLTVGAAGAATAAAAVPRNTTPSQEHNRANPFGNHAEAIDATNARGAEPIHSTSASATGEIVIATAAGAAAGATAGLARGASKRGNGPKPLDFTTKGGVFMGPPSPAGTDFSTSSETASNPAATGTAAAIAAAGGPANSTVHRVQLDFKPSMDDELELRAGQLIRLLHEYDDGWALCIRLDRSQQGVVPRTCLSTRPVKPRPQQNGPRGPPPGQRAPGPQGQMRSMSPAMNGPPRGPGMNGSPRPASPSGRNSPGPQYNGQRPMTPQGQGRPRSPSVAQQGQGRPRSPSVAQQQGRRNSPPGPSPMNPAVQSEGPKPASVPAPAPAMGSSPPTHTPVGRKPVPGQAM